MIKIRVITKVKNIVKTQNLLTIEKIAHINTNNI